MNGGIFHYVSTTGSDEGNDGMTPDTAFATLKKALADIADGDEVRILEGTFDAASNVVVSTANASAYEISNDIRIVGAGRDKTILTANHLPKDTRLFQLNNAEAVLSSLTLSNVVYLDSFYDCGHGVLLTAGKVLNCAFRNFTQSGFHATGAGIHVPGADTLVSNCVFNTMTVGAVSVTGAGRLYDIEVVSGGSGCSGEAQIYVNATGALVDGLYVHDGTTRGLTVDAGTVQNALICRQTVSRNGKGAGLYQNGGRVERCRIIGNEETTGEQGGGVYLAGGVLANALILSNKTTSASGVWQTGGTMINCTLADNIATQEGGFEAIVTAGKAYNNLFAGDTVPAVSIADDVPQAGNKTGTKAEFFSIRKSNAWHLKAGSSAVDAGDNAAVEEFGLTTDLDGNDRIWRKARISNAAVDVGCYERSPVGMMVIVR